MELLLLCGCRPADDGAQTLRISWTGVPARIEGMVENYVHGRNVPRSLDSSILNPKYFARPTPFFLFEGNDDAVTLALSARLGTSYPPVDVYFIDLYWFMDFEPEWLTSFQAMTVPINGREVPLRDTLPYSLREACELNNQLYAVPLSIRGNCLYYRSDLVAHPPRTWPELIDVARRTLAGQPPGSRLKYGLVFHWNELHNDLYPLLWGYGGGPPNCLIDGNRLDQPLASDANLQALEMFYGLVHTAGISPSIAELRLASLTEEKNLFESFANGEALFLIDWTNRAARIAGTMSRLLPAELSAEHIGIAPIPHGPNQDHSYSTIGSWGWVLASDPRSNHSAAFVRELAAPGAQLYFFEQHAEVPIYRRQVLEELEQWPEASRRLTPYHTQLLQLVHGSSDQPAVVLRDRPGRKEVNRLVLSALQQVLQLPPTSDRLSPLDRDKARQILARADRSISQFLERLVRLGMDCSCGGGADRSASSRGEAAPGLQTPAGGPP